jgi:paraquat-inducible protein B
VGSSTIGDLLQQTAAEIEKKKEEEEKIEEAASAALRVETFSENNVLPSNYPFLADLQDSRGQQICLKMNNDIQKLLREIMKMSRQVRSVNLLKVVNSNDVTTSLVEVPCSAKQSGFKKQSRRLGWVKQILYNVRKNKEKELPMDAADGDEYDDNNNDERAYTNADTARWLMTYLGDAILLSPSSQLKHWTCQSTRERWMQSTRRQCGWMRALVLLLSASL